MVAKSFAAETDSMLPIRRILVPVDFSPISAKIVHYASGLAAHFDVAPQPANGSKPEERLSKTSSGRADQEVRPEVVLLHVMQLPDYLIRAYETKELPNLAEGIRRECETRLLQLAQMVPADVRHCTELREGEAFERILEFAEERHVDLIVMGTQGHTGVQHLLLGSTAERVVRLAKCPVLTIGLAAAG